jgi:hypothetical protein
MLNIEKFKLHIGVLLLKYYLGRNSSPFSENTIRIINAAFEVLFDKQ